MPRERGRKGEKKALEDAEEKRAKTARRRSGCWRNATMMLLGRMRWDIQRLLLVGHPAALLILEARNALQSMGQ